MYYGVTDSGDDIDLSYRGTDSVVTGKPYSQINFELKHGDTMDKYNKVHTNDSSQTRMEHNPFSDSSIQTTLPRDGTKEIALNVALLDLNPGQALEHQADLSRGSQSLARCANPMPKRLVHRLQKTRLLRLSLKI